MKRILILTAFTVILLVNMAFATPPTNIALSYDLANGVLHITADHPTQKITKHFIRKVTVSTNNGTPAVYYFPKQKDASQFAEDISLVAKPEDVIHVDLLCSEGGSGQAETTVASE